ncbi:MAG: aspartate/glutamate racemase family protein, partial [Deltaproteobacteria bacterium]|nr:aspartate/glutamate racemase family protein [Deltaproteobacteria bacterium]
MIYKGKKGQYTGGEAIGILTLESSPVAFIPGDVNNASTYPFPIRYQNVDGFSVQKAIGKDPSIYKNLLESAKSLEQQGVRAITGGCGFMGIHQKKLAKEIEVPIFLSS